MTTSPALALCESSPYIQSGRCLLLCLAFLPSTGFSQHDVELVTKQLRTLFEDITQIIQLCVGKIMKQLGFLFGIVAEIAQLFLRITPVLIHLNKCLQVYFLIKELLKTLARLRRNLL